LENPPLEVARQGIDAIRAYFEQLEREGTDTLYEAKLLIGNRSPLPPSIPPWQELVWRSGVVLEQGGTRAEVIEYYDKRQIALRVTGANRRNLLTVVAYELDKIHHSYPGLKYKKLIPCNCDQCKSSQSPHFYPFEMLKRARAAGKPVQCAESFEMVDALRLIDDAGQSARGRRDAADMRHLKLMITEKSRRMRVLKEQIASSGNSAPPEKVTEIEDLEREIADLEQELFTARRLIPTQSVGTREQSLGTRMKILHFEL